MKVINMTYNPITGVQYTTIEIPDTKTNRGATAAITAYKRTKQMQQKSIARLRKNNTKHK